MTLHRLTNIALLVGLLVTWFLVMDSDYRNDADTALQQERREYMQAIQFCHRTAGPQTAPEYTEENRLVCVGKRGQRHNEVRLAKQ